MKNRKNLLNQSLNHKNKWRNSSIIMKENKDKLYGILAEFRNPKELIDAARRVKETGYSDFDTYAPFPIHGMEEAMGVKKSKLGWIVFAGGLLGGGGILWLMIWVMTGPWDLNIGGMPFLNLPIYVPITFELTVLIAAFAAVFGLLYLNGLPKLNNPLFNVDRFDKASDDGFFLCIEATDNLFSEEDINKIFTDAGAIHIENVHPSEGEEFTLSPV